MKYSTFFHIIFDMLESSSSSNESNESNDTDFKEFMDQIDVMISKNNIS